MSNDNVKMVNRIKKLMALGLSDPDSPEAKSSMEKAGALMAQYNIDNLDLSGEESSSVNASLTETWVEVYNKYSDIWESPLGNRLAKCMDCRMLNLRNGRSLPTRTFMGTEKDVELVVHFFKFIRMQIQRMSEVKFTNQKDKATYGYGATVKVIERLEEMYKVKEERIAMSNCTALMVVKSGEVDAFVNERYKVRKGRKRTLPGSHNAFVQGKKDGDKVSINRQIR